MARNDSEMSLFEGLNEMNQFEDEAAVTGATLNAEPPQPQMLVRRNTSLESVLITGFR